MALKSVDFRRLPTALQDKVKARSTKTVLKSDLSHEERGLDARFGYVRKRIADLPKIFDGRVKWADFITGIRDQGACGSSWAWATTACLSDRISLRSFGRISPTLSPVPLLLCSGAEEDKKYGKSGCGYASILRSFIYLYVHGTTTESCGGTTKEDLPICTEAMGPSKDLCRGSSSNPVTTVERGTPARKYRAVAPVVVAGTRAQGGDDISIMSEIYLNGPVVSGFTVYPDFYNFDAKSEIYEWQGVGPAVGGHAVRILGWGVDAGTDYWIVANSWGADWGENGYFRMVRGKNNCGIESNVYACVPDMFYAIDIVLPRAIQRYVDKVPWDIQLQRLDMDFGKDVVAGGIDPETGYSRRCMYTYTGFNFRRVLEEPETNSIMVVDNFTAALVSGTVEGYEPECDQPWKYLLILVVAIIILMVAAICLLPK